MEESKTPIAVVGVSTLFPGSIDSTGFWKDILAGTDLITDVPPTHWLIEDYYDPDPKAPDKTYAKRGAFVPAVDFDPMAWGVPPSTVPATDTCQLLALIVAQRVLDDAGRGMDDSARERMSVILGVTSAQELLGAMVSRLQRPVWTKSLREMGLSESQVQEACTRIEAHYTPWQEATFPGVLGNVVAGRIANRLNLGGTNCVTDAACASTFSALSMAVNELRLGQSDTVICGGADTMNDIFMYLCFSKTPALSKSGDCRPFSDKADGTMLGEGFGMVALKRLEDAEKDGDRVYAVIRGVGSSSDGKGTAVYAPVPSGQAKAIRRAYAQAGFGPDTVDLIEAHGTGTIAGDAAEFEGLRMVFDESGRKDRQWCALGSVKAQIGHTKAAAGAAGLVKAVLALHHKVIPPTIKVDAPNPKLDLPQSPFHLEKRARPWIKSPSEKRRAGVSSFGFGGSNFHVAVEEYVGDAHAYRRRATETELFCLSGATPKAVADAAREMARECTDDAMFAFFATDSQAAYDANAECRLALVAKHTEDLRTKLEKAATRVEAGEPFETPDGTCFGTGRDLGDVAFLFPGQGSQYVDMSGALAMTWETAREPWDLAASLDVFCGAAKQPKAKPEASRLAVAEGDENRGLAAGAKDSIEDDAFGDTKLHDVVFPPAQFRDGVDEENETRLRATEWAQPGIGAASLSLLRLLREIGLTAKAVAGHSFGEIIALHAAGVLSEEDALRVARRRGELMAEAAATPGSMTAVSADAEKVRALIASWGLPVVLANHNGPTQVVLSGPTDAIEQAEEKLKAEKLRFRRLPVATAFHSSVVAASTKPFGEFLAGVEIAEATIPAYGNTNAEPYPTDASAIREIIANQIAKPVRFVEEVEAMYAAGVRSFVEVGPGNVLAGLVKRILGDRPHRVVSLDRKGRNAVTSLWHGLAQLVAAGAPMQLSALASDFAPLEDPRTTKKPKLAMAICGANYGKPYPPPEGAAVLPKPNPEKPKAEPRTEPRTEPVKVSETRKTIPVPEKKSDSHTPTAMRPPAPVAVPAAPAVPVAMPAGWAGAYLEVQRQAAEAHSVYSTAMANAHMAFLQAQQTSMQTLATMMTGQPIAQPQMPALPQLPQPAPVAVPARAPVVPAAAPVAAPVAVPAPAPIAPEPVPAPSAGTGTGTGASSRSASADVDLQALMLHVVAEKTGYPVDMLELSMDLEGDLGVDSIKRVEILAAMREQAPNLPEVDPAELGKLRTLQEIVDRMGSELGASAGTGTGTGASPSASAAVDLQALMLQVVAEKTGYPVDMLELSMDLEGDLGVDSIKRVEILAAMREQAPNLPEVDPAELGKLRTLQEIVDRMGSELGASAGTGTGTGTEPRVEQQALGTGTGASPSASAVDLQHLMLQVVAEKTGYPVDMLELSMDLEGDLGVDSIKRVEILAAMREQAPNLPEVDPAELGKLRTLQEIVDRMSLEGATSSQSASTGTGTGAGASPSASAARYVLRLTDAPATGFALRGLLSAEHIAITRDGKGIAEALAAELSVQGAKVEVVDAPSKHDGLIELRGLADFASIDEALAIQRSAFIAAKSIAKSPRIFVTVQDTDGDFGLGGSERAWIGGLSGLAKTAALEWPDAGVRAIDIARDERSAADIAAAIANELLHGGRASVADASGGGIEIALSASGKRRTLTSRPEDVRESTPRIDAESIVLASGGARGVTAKTLIRLAEKSKCKLVLLGRTALTDEPASIAGIEGDAQIKAALLADAKSRGEKMSPVQLGAMAKSFLAAREVRETLDAIAKAGGEARYLAVDVTNAEKLNAALDEIRTDWGAITAIVHGAGVLADRFIADKTEDQFDFVFGVKAKGLQVLLDATHDDEIDTLITFSSVAGRCGNPGQVDYAMANETLNKVCAQASRRGIFARSLGWGPWEGGMVTPALKQHFERLGVPLIGLDQGAKMLVDELRDGSSNVELVLGGKPSADALAPRNPNAELSYDVLIDRTTFPTIDDHRVKGQPVLPAAMVMELFARAIQTTRPELVFAGVEELRVLKGVVLENYETIGDWLTITAKQISNGNGVRLALQLVDGEGRPRYSATGIAERQIPSAGVIPPRPEGLSAFDRTVYDGVALFHGDAFKVIVDTPDVGASGLEAQLVGGIDRGWAKSGWATDPALVDGGLQLALLWTTHADGGAALPTSIGELRRYRSGLVKGPVQARLRGHELRDERSVSDVVFFDASGGIIAELIGVEMHVLPGSRKRESVRA